MYTHVRVCCGVRAHMHTCIYTCARVLLRVWVHAHLCTCTHVCLCAYYALCIHGGTRVHMYTNVCVHMHMWELYSLGSTLSVCSIFWSSGSTLTHVPTGCPSPSHRAGAVPR